MPTLAHLLTGEPFRGRPQNRDPVTRIGSLICSGLAAAVARVATLTLAAVGHAAGISLDMDGVPIPVAGFGVPTTMFSASRMCKLRRCLVA